MFFTLIFSSLIPRVVAFEQVSMTFLLYKGTQYLYQKLHLKYLYSLLCNIYV
jgi:hypothetical protein